jgi:hypothetical protein
MFVIAFPCCPETVEAFAMGRSLVQRSPTKYVNKIKKPPVCEVAMVLSRTVEPLWMRERKHNIA